MSEAHAPGDDAGPNGSREAREPARHAPGTDRGGERVVCHACAFSNAPENIFCGGCGSALRDQAAERRELTVFFCDLAQSTALSAALDPEEFSEIITAYQAACKTIIERRYEGVIRRYFGDGILATFGTPAHEDDPERAVLAGLEIVSAVASLRVAPQPLAVRVGIATGLVVVGDLIDGGASERHAVRGETANLAARLQDLAAPGTVLIASSTRALLGDGCECVESGVHSLKGFSQPVRVWRVLTARPGAVRPRNRLLPLVDREEYTRWLHRLWQQAKASHGRVALLCGEAGIGKSRIVEALRENIAGTPYAALRFQCAPHFVHTSMYPVIEQIEREAGIRHEATASERLELLERWVAQAEEGREAIGLLAALLSIPTHTPDALPPMSPRRQKERTFEVLLQIIERRAAAWALPIVFEDVHWVDPTTREFLTLLIDRVRHMRVLLVITYRPVFTAPWLDRPHVTHMVVEKLSPEHAAQLAADVGGEQLGGDVLQELVAKADGVPLFVEELTKFVLGFAGERDGEMLERLSGGELGSVPATLQAFLMERLDQVGQAKAIAQVASAIGREFTYGLLEAVADLSGERLREGLQILEESGLIYREPGLHVARYAFKHALVRDAAYHTLLLKRRRELHTRIAWALENRFPQTVRDAPELVARHWTRAGEIERAVAAWLAAGQRASQRSAYEDAIAHLRRGLRLVARLRDADSQRDYELALLLALAPALITTQGARKSDAGALYARALALCNDAPDSESRFVAQWGWWRVCMNHRDGRDRADRLIDLANRFGNSELKLQAHHCQWATLYMLGSHAECCRHIEAGLSLYDPERERVQIGRYGGHDARVCAFGEGGLAQWMLGRPERALDFAQSAVGWAHALAHVGSRVHAMDYALVLRKFRGDVRDVYDQASELAAYAAEQKLIVHRAKGAFFRGWARALKDDVNAGLKEMLEGIAAEEASDTPHDFTLYYEMLAEVYGLAGRLDEALTALAEAFAIAEQHGIVFWNAELHRRRGELLRATGDDTAAEAEYGQALRWAREQGARALELRTAMSLASLYKRQGRCEAGRSLLEPIYRSFKEGFDTADLQAARALMEALT